MRFIVVDGLDAAGKDTHARMIRDKYLAEGENVILRSHPTRDTKYGRKAKKYLLGQGKKDRFKASLYYSYDVINSLKKYYGKADTVIFVRYLCGVAYLPNPLDRFFYDFFSGLLPTSPYMFFLDVNPEESLKRLEKRDEIEMFENREALRKVRKKALRLVDDWHIIDTTQSIRQAQRKIENILDTLDNNGFDMESNHPDDTRTNSREYERFYN